jgi:hypothetical protein
MNCLRPLEHPDRGFEFHSRHGCLFAFALCFCFYWCSKWHCRLAGPPTPPKEFYRVCIGLGNWKKCSRSKELYTLRQSKYSYTETGICLVRNMLAYALKHPHPQRPLAEQREGMLPAVSGEGRSSNKHRLLPTDRLGHLCLARGDKSKRKMPKIRDWFKYKKNSILHLAHEGEKCNKPVNILVYLQSEA